MVTHTPRTYLCLKSNRSKVLSAVCLTTLNGVSPNIVLLNLKERVLEKKTTTSPTKQTIVGLLKSWAQKQILVFLSCRAYMMNKT